MKIVKLTHLKFDITVRGITVSYYLGTRSNALFHDLTMPPIKDYKDMQAKGNYTDKEMTIIALTLSLDIENGYKEYSSYVEPAARSVYNHASDSI